MALDPTPATNPATDKKLTPSEVLYMEIPKGPLSCGNCAMWVKDTNRCTAHKKDQEVTGDMICGLYVNGEPLDSGHAVWMGEGLDPEVTGLGKGNTNCGNCVYGSGAPKCEHPCLSAFPIDNQNGCCNAHVLRPDGLRMLQIRTKAGV